MMTTCPGRSDMTDRQARNPVEPVAHAVLVVDDDPRVRNAVKRCLRNEPYDLLLAESGQQALETMTQSSVHVVVSDMGMPGMDGITVLSEVAERWPRVIRMVLSGQSESRYILDAINNGQIYRYILKPWENDHLKIVIRQALTLWDLHNDRERLLDALQAHNRHLEETVAQRTRQMLAVERQADIGRYASQIVHNLSNPLHAISASLEPLDTYVDGNLLKQEKLKKGVTIARSAADDLRQIIAGILTHAGEAEQFSMAALDLNGLIEKEIAFFDMIPAFKYDVEKQVRLDRSVPRIRGNPIQIKQILGNLIKNALDAMERVAVKRLSIDTAAEDGYAVIRLADTGHGIAAEDLDRIFSADFTTKPVDKGTGLGLASVHAMVAAYAGSIQVESGPGRGTTFIVRFPALPEAEQQS